MIKRFIICGALTYCYTLFLTIGDDNVVFMIGSGRVQVFHYPGLFDLTFVGLLFLFRFFVLQCSGCFLGGFGTRHRGGRLRVVYHGRF